jgi:HK97 family phage major capsid protein
MRNMPSAKLAQLQDESVAIEKEITDLRAIEPKDDAEKAQIEQRLAERGERALEVAKLAQAEHDLDAKVAALRGVRAASDSDSRATVEERKAPAVHVMPGRDAKGFGSNEAAAKAGRFLRALARGDVNEMRAMGETSPTFDGKGSELVSPELFRGFIDVLGYSSVGLQVASLYQTSSNSIVVPKIGEIEASWFDEQGTMTGDEMTTDKVEIALHKMGRLIEISNELAEDAAAVVALAQTVANRFALAIGKKIDTVWLQGDAGKGIDGLVGEISNDNTVAQGVDNDGVDLAELVGKIDSRAVNTAWVVSSAGWAHIMKASVVTQSTTIGDRVLPVVMGAPVYRCLGLPTGTLALYGDFAMATAVAYKANGLQVAASEHASFAKDSVVFRGTQRVGIANHDASFVAKLIVD